MTQGDAAFQVRQVAHGSPAWRETVALRDAVLRRPLGLAFTEDELARESAQLHLALTAGGVLAGVVVLVPPDAAADDPRRWKLRQMAVAPGSRGTGAGTTLLAAAEELMRARGATTVALHARDTAIGFYRRAGYRVRGAAFVEVTIPHRLMWKRLAAG